MLPQVPGLLVNIAHFPKLNKSSDEQRNDPRKETTQETGHLTRDLAAGALGVETAPNFLNPASEPSPFVQGIFEPE
jgi:hypothetical protein